MEIPTVQEMLSESNPQRASLDANLAKKHLQSRIFGEQVVEVINLDVNANRAAIGTDASVGDIFIKHARGSFIPPTPAVLFVASAAMRVRDSGSILPYWDYDIAPRELEKYEDLEAAERGLLISPRLRREAITDFRHLRSAAMELRQYSQELRVVRGESKWFPISNAPELNQPPETSLMIRDGRIFPLVHRLDDYDGASAPDDILYGEVVRREIRAFDDVFSSTAGRGRLGAIYSGAVKSPEFSWFAMLNSWYLQVKCKVPDIQDGFYRPPLNDQAVTHLLFWGLAEKKSDVVFQDRRSFFLTFRILRRYSDIAFQSAPQVIIDQNNIGADRVLNEDNEDDWIEYIQQHITDANDRYNKHKRGVPALESVKSYDAFINACRRSAVVMHYGAPTRMYKAVLESGGHFLLPRWEMLVDVSTLKQKNLDDNLNSLLSWLVEDDGLVKDETHAVAGHQEVDTSLPLYIPDVVKQAHDMVTYTRDRHVSDVGEKLYQLVRDIREGKILSVQ